MTLKQPQLPNGPVTGQTSNDKTLKTLGLLIRSMKQLNIILKQIALNLIN